MRDVYLSRNEAFFEEQCIGDSVLSEPLAESTGGFIDATDVVYDGI
jgi:hypothetical protein